MPYAPTFPTMQKILTPDAPQPIGPYSQAILAGNTLYCSGQIPLDPYTNTMVPGGITEQTERVCKNIEAVLTAAGVGFDNVVKANCYLTDMANFAAFNAVFAKYFTSAPARACIAAKQLPKDSLVEIEVIAVV